MPPIHSLATELRALPRAFWVIFAGTFINRFGSFVYPFLTILLHRRGFDYGSIGIARRSFGLPGVVLSLSPRRVCGRLPRAQSLLLRPLLHPPLPSAASS